DLAGLRQETMESADVGFAAKACIHPTQVETVLDAFAPTIQQTTRATRIVAEAEHQAGAFALDGQMVDAPIIARARHVLGHAAPSRHARIQDEEGGLR
ncbi:MAG TPA: HpcH/HpaI aldolase/citrate lyase family protein, partial [Nitrolancea sp.]|nr:HpcH/HpaI aldolase/citrate lyase family protein [Nitrolancea sp.]